MREMCNTVASPHTFQLAADATACKKKKPKLAKLSRRSRRLSSLFFRKEEASQKDNKQTNQTPIELVC